MRSMATKHRVRTISKGDNGLPTVCSPQGTLEYPLRAAFTGHRGPGFVSIKINVYSSLRKVCPHSSLGQILVGISMIQCSKLQG